jgi:DNA polymerase-3 subunit delta
MKRSEPFPAMKGSSTRDGSEWIQDEIRKKAFAPVYYIHGEDDFLVDEAVELLADAAIREADRGFNFDVVDGAEADPRAVVTLASTFPMMSERRVVVVKNADKINEARVVSGYLENPSASTVLIFAATDPDKRRSMHKALAAGARAIELPRLFANQIPAWIQKHAARRGLTIDDAASSLLAEFVGTDLREAWSELEKISVYAGSRKNLTVEDVQAVSGMTREINLYELHHAMAVRDEGKAMELLERLVDGGQPPIRIAVSIGFFYITARKLSDIRRRGGSDAELRLRPSMLKDYQAIIARYSEVDLDNALLAIADADEQLKSSPFPPKQILQTMAATILSGSGNSFLP